ncbi:MAG TPA: CHASE domain-containing protein [Thermoanaerobaculia bacterium]|nr:CHASE domain-containing protein [Thermoanaerobaculia bacterium]
MITSGGTGISGPTETSRFTIRRIRSAFFLWRSSLRVTDLLIAAVFVALSLGLGAYVFARGRAAVHLAFAQRAKDVQARVSERLSSSLENLYTLQSFMEASDRPVTRDWFRLLAYPMLARSREVYAFEWLPYVKDADRAVYEMDAKKAHLTDSGFWEKGSDGKRVAAGRRPFYVPVHYMEPPSNLALGFDIASEATRWSAAVKACDIGDLYASVPFELLEEEGRKTWPVVAVYGPVYRDGDPGSPAKRLEKLRGFATAIFRVAPVVDKAAAQADAAGLGLRLRDLEAPGTPALAERPTDAASLTRRDAFELSFIVLFAGRRWTLDVFALPGAFLPSRRGAVEAALFGILASLVGLVTVTALRTIARLRRQAEKVGPYRLVKKLGKGAMGVVWEARHALLRRPTAVKLLAPGVEGERAIARFEREVQLTAGLTHPSTIAIYDYGRTADHVFYYAMELLRGINLGQLVAFDGPLPARRVVYLLRQACGALAEAHAAGLIHRDIKPQNVMLCVYGGIPDFVKILDFGLVKEIGDVERGAADGPGSSDAALSQDGSLLGTPLYMAPEGMSDPGNVDARADIFGLGAVGYFLLTGRAPFPGRTALEVFKLERQGPPASMAGAAKEEVPRALEDLLRRCLSADRNARPATAEELDAALEACAVAPAWTIAEARAWWKDRGAEALAAAAAEHEEREERGQFLMLSSDFRGRG